MKLEKFMETAFSGHFIGACLVIGGIIGVAIGLALRGM